ncbi:helix-turn-helix domain-containing protein [Corynebacterium provencense]|uniref:helix-turn-helix domain-containing protein n=1 Tax=Corynebacterium provencense TaxID=1737425 RepID=UPI000D7BE99F|nr:helix-turn-helix domain-containing protein [Corynebacterium provencense]
MPQGPPCGTGHCRSYQTARSTFTTVTGDHFPRWRASLRVNAARKLLDRGENVGTAARKVGYSHASGLTKTFREVLGITPSGYIRQRRWLH